MQGTKVQELPAIAEEAYLYGFPMIVGYKVLHDFFIARSSGQFKARSSSRDVTRPPGGSSPSRTSSSR